MDRIKPKKEIDQKIRNQCILLVTKICAIIVVAFIAFQYIFGFYYIRGNYMFPAIKDGDIVITYKLKEISREDVVIYKIDGETRLGRVVALEGDTVNFSEDGELIINNCAVNEEIFYDSTPAENSKVEYPYTVPENKVFILNDYRSGYSESHEDSTTYGSISNKDIEGKACFLFRRRGI